VKQPYSQEHRRELKVGSNQ